MSEPCNEELDFLAAIEAHVRWKIRLEAYINGTSEEQLDPDVVGRDDQCPLGKWINGCGGDRYGNHPKFAGLRETHTAFHSCAGEVIRKADAGQKDDAHTLLCRGDYAKYSHRIKSDLARMSLELEKLD